jgi:hypothetical protein
MCVVSALALVCCAGSAWSATINVPGDQPTIQSAINAAVAGDEILVAPGVYAERIDFLGKAITVRSAGGAAVTTIDASTLTLPTGPVVLFTQGEGPGAVLDGFTITGGSGTRGAGARIGTTTVASSPTIQNVVFLNNSSDSATSTLRRGGAVSIQSPTAAPVSSPTFINVVFTGNTSGSTTRTSARGGAVDIAGGVITFTGCTFTNNRVIGSTSGNVTGGAIHIDSGTVTISNSTFTTNASQGSTSGSSGAFGGAINMANGSLTVNNTTFTGNTSTSDGATIAQANGTTTVSGGSIANSSGGGGSAFRSINGQATFTGVTFTGNSSTTNIIVQLNNPATGTAGPFTFTNCSFTTTTGQTAVRMATIGGEVIFNGGSFTNATGNGNAVFASDPTSTLRITGTTFQGYGTATTAAGTGIVNGATYTGNGIGARFGNGSNTTAAHVLATSTFTGNGTGVTLSSGTLTSTGTSIDGTGFAGNRIGLAASSGSTLLATGLNVRGTNRGAINLTDADATITGGLITENTGFGSNGVLSTVGGTVTIEGVTISLSTGVAFSAAETTLTLNNSQVINNNGIGTALISATTQAMSISGNTFRGNTSISDTLALSLDPTTSPVVVGNTFDNNTSSSVIAVSDGTPTIRRNLIIGNTNSAGSGTINISGGSPLIDGNRVLGNNVGSGSVINCASASGTTVLVNNVLASNTAGEAAVNIADSNATLSQNSIVQNSGAGLSSSTTGTVTVANSIVRGNLGGAFDVFVGSIAVNSTNYEGGATGGGTGNIDQAQTFVDADGPDNIANTADDNYRLPSGSPGINAGSNTLVPAGITQDLAGNARIAGGIVDQGAYELAGPTACNASDVAGANQSVGGDGQLTADDIIVFLGWFFNNDPRADVAGPNQSTTPDTIFTADDIIVFLGRYFQGC